MTRFSIAVLGVSMGALGVLAASCGFAGAQIILPGAAVPAGSGQPADARPARKPDKPEKSAADFSVGVTAVVGRPLRLDGKRGRLLLSGHGKLVRIDKFSLPGEVISDPSQKCLIDIVGEAPIEAKNLGRPDGLARYQAEIPACPFTFDLLDGAVRRSIGQDLDGAASEPPAGDAHEQRNDERRGGIGPRQAKMHADETDQHGQRRP